MLRLVRAILGRLRRRHPISWCAALLTAVVMTLIIVPAGYERQRFDPSNGPPNWLDEQLHVVYYQTQREIQTRKQDGTLESDARAALYRHFFGVRKWDFVRPVVKQHGWPRPFLVRSLPLVPGEGQITTFTTPRRIKPFEHCSWLYASNWPTAATVWRIHPGNLALCALVWVLAVGGAGATAEWWVRSRGGLLRFRLIDLLTAATMVAVLFGWWSYHARVGKIEQQVIGQLVDNPRRASLSFHSEYVGPVWLARLLGDDHSLPHFWHITFAERNVRPDWREQITQITRLSYLRTLRLRGQVSIEAIDSLTSLNQLHSMAIWHTRDTMQEPLSATQSLIPGNVDRLARLELRDLSLAWPDLLITDVERLLDATNLERIELRNPMITEGELDRLRASYPNVDIIVAWNFPHDRDSPEAEEAIAEARKRRRP